ncbi:uncharacterized protein [Periplaneta americana]|uniref:uncharacterized protein isoform X2 n=1 Tax=Periplaneta americana TaxID=6978 RepID=UPI0037E8738C
MEGEGRFSNPYLQAVLEDIIKEEGFINPQVKIEVGSNKGDNYLGAIYRVQVDGKRVKNEFNQDTLRIIFKCLPQSKARREQMESSVYFKNEVNFYNRVLQEFLSFQREKGINSEDGFSCTARCYRALAEVNEMNVNDVEEVLVLEDLREKGYKMANRRVGLSVVHCQLVLEQLAKLHAFSFAMRDQRPEQFNSLKKSVNETLFTTAKREGFEENVKCHEDKIEEALTTRIPGDNIYTTRMHEFLKNFYDNMLMCVDGAAADPYAVICHGDCWTNNMLFKFSKNDSEPTDVAFLDFQLSRYASPVLDIAYFIFCCTDQTLRSKHYRHLLTKYYDTLAHFICQLGSDPQKLYPANVFKSIRRLVGTYDTNKAPLMRQLIQEIIDDG